METPLRIETVPLSNKKIILGVTGGIAAYKAAELCRLLIKAGADVQVVMTAAACRFVTPLTFQALSGKPVRVSLWEQDSSPGGRAVDGMDHIHLSRDVDLILVAPASADFIARLAAGRADDMLTALCLARSAALAIAPAMNREMWAAAPTQRNVAQIEADGVHRFGPAAGEQACGEVGLGRMLEPAELVAALDGLLGQGLLAGKRVVVTAGPTFEPIDPVRGLTNLSSGKMGFAIARAAAAAGAEVCLVAGPTCLPTPSGVQRVDITTAAEMRAAVHAALPAEVFIAVAAVSDFRVAATETQKIKKSPEGLSLTLVTNPDILAEIAALPTPPFCVGFAAETERLAEHAEAKREAKRLPVLVGNLAQDSLGQDAAELTIFDARGRHALPRADKLTQARRLIEHIAPLLN